MFIYRHVVNTVRLIQDWSMHN